MPQNGDKLPFLHVQVHPIQSMNLHLRLILTVLGILMLQPLGPYNSHA